MSWVKCSVVIMEGKSRVNVGKYILVGFLLLDGVGGFGDNFVKFDNGLGGGLFEGKIGFLVVVSFLFYELLDMCICML